VVGQVLALDGSGKFVWSSPALGTLLQVGGTPPLVSSGGDTPQISLLAVSASANGYLSQSDWTLFNNKQADLINPSSGEYLRGDHSLADFSNQFLASVISNFSTSNTGAITASDTIINAINKLDGTINGKVTSFTKGNIVSSDSSYLTVTDGSAGVASAGISIAVKAASTSVSGYLKSVDWNTFNSQQNQLATGTSIDYMKGDLTLGSFASTVLNSLMDGFSAAPGTVAASELI